ncbi:MAG: MaoC family dehydratase [Gordonia sp. (in: high G+C Gram-positive bacteria)]|uniref:MaoC family dehydratase n=1 Tax=Gordonia sp. (in: high G+C Gram-positive bacteria) TaxID=84139 RepID=UPI003BB7D991
MPSHDLRTITGAAELIAATGQVLGASDWHTITQEQVDTFAEATGDHQWIHVDPQRAADGPFGTTIAHGYLTLSLVPMLRKQAWVLAGTTMGINYGANKIRFPAAVPVGSRVRATFELLDVAETRGGYRLIEKVTAEVPGGGKPVMIAETVTVVVFA